MLEIGPTILMSYCLFYCHNSFCTVFWVSSFYLSVNIVVLYQFMVTCIENFASKAEARGLSDGKKVQGCDYVFGSLTTFQRKKGMDLGK